MTEVEMIEILKIATSLVRVFTSLVVLGAVMYCGITIVRTLNGK